MLVAAFLCSLMPLAHVEAQSFFVTFLLSAFAAGGVISIYPYAPSYNFPRSPLLVIAAAFWALAGLSVFLSAAPYVSLIYFCFFSVFPLAFIAVLLTPDKGALYKGVGIALAVLFAGLSVASLAQYFIFPETLPGYERVQWPLANPNSLAALYVTGFFCTLGVMLAVKNRIHSNLALGLAILIVAAIFTTGSRGAFASLLAGLVVFAAFASVYFKVHRRCVGMLAVCAAALFGVFALFAPEGNYTLAHALQASFSSATPASTFSERTALWLSSWAIIGDHFWTGTGIGTFFLYYPQYRGADFTTAGLMAHNDPLQFWTEMGVFAPVLFYAFVAGGAIRTWRALKILAVDDVRRIYILTPACAFTALILYCHLTYLFYVLCILMLAGVLLGFWYDQTQKILQTKSIAVKFKNENIFQVSRIALLLPLAILIYSFTTIHGSYLLTQRAQERMATGDINGFAEDVNRANALAPGKNERAYILAAAIPMGILESQVNALSPEEATKLYKQADDLLIKAFAINPRVATILYYRAWLVRLSKKPGAEDFLQEALALDPVHVASRLMLADIYKEQGESKKSYEVLKDGMKWEEVYADPVQFFKSLSTAAKEQSDQKTENFARERIERYRMRQSEAAQRNILPFSDLKDLLPAQRTTQQRLEKSLREALGDKNG